jgi:hypothetical protein
MKSLTCQDQNLTGFFVTMLPQPEVSRALF